MPNFEAILRYCYLTVYKVAAVCHLGFLKVQNFNCQYS